MCAIHGYCWQDEKLIGEMLCKAHHRGPDGQGTFFNDDISLGHNLLSITDTPSQSKQPWEYKDIVLVFNGEIYNHMDLRKSLDYKFDTETDTETLAVGLEKKGIKFIYELVSKEENEMLKYKNFGRKSLTELVEKLDQMGLSFGMEVDKYLKEEV